MRTGFDPNEETQKVDKPTPFERAVLRVGFAAILLAIGLLALRGCLATAQEAPTLLLPEIVYDGDTFGPVQNDTNLLKRPQQPRVPPLPGKVSRMVSTNDVGEEITVLIKKPADPAPLIQDRRKERWFWTWCPLCEERRHFKADAIKIVGWRTDTNASDEVIAERQLFFTCRDCTNAFTIRDERRIKQPTAVEVPPPTAKGSKP